MFFFAAKVLRACDVEFETYDVLTNPGVREGIKVKHAFRQTHTHTHKHTPSSCAIACMYCCCTAV